MNEPIISPWLFYAVDVLGTIDTFTCIFLVILTVPFVLCFAGYLVSIYDDKADNTDREIEFIHKVFLVMFKLICFLVMLNICTPSNETLYKMAAAYYITPANVESVGESVDKIADKIVDKINKVKR